MIADETACNAESLEVGDGISVAQLNKLVVNRHPGLTQLNYKIAVNCQLKEDDAIITDQSEIALLPPFAGG